MIVQVIQNRYLVDYDVLNTYLSSMFKPSEYEIIVCASSQYSESSTLLIGSQSPDEGEKWKVKIPRELTRVSYNILEGKSRG